MNVKSGELQGEKGFTLVELLVVLSILAVLAAVVFPTVTGVNTSARNTAQLADIQGMQTGVDRFNADDTDGSPWPTKDRFSGGAAWSQGNLPTASYSGSGTPADPYVFPLDAIAGVAFTSTATVSGTKTFYLDYVSKPKHVSDTITVAATSTSSSFTINKGAVTATVVLSNGTSSTVNFDAWGIDKNGRVWVFVDKDSY